jgi:hypothetical protein
MSVPRCDPERSDTDQRRSRRWRTKCKQHSDNISMPTSRGIPKRIAATLLHRIYRRTGFDQQ